MVREAKDIIWGRGDSNSLLRLQPAGRARDCGKEYGYNKPP